MEVMRDRDDNVVIICSIENFDAMGVHTGDSITVAPAQTLTDKEYQRMRDASLAVIREIGVETGGSNIQFAIDPKSGRMIVIEMNPRVSRSSALASKATGFPIAKIAAKLAVGYRLWELPNDITKKTKACFEPTIDYVVTKIPRFAFEKFPEADATLTTQMKSVGETMAIGRTFRESLQKALRGLEVGAFGLGSDSRDLWGTDDQPDEHTILTKLGIPNAQRLFYIRYALKFGMSVEQVHEVTHIDPWFLDHISQIVEHENELREMGSLEAMTRDQMWDAKRNGFSDRQLAKIFSSTEGTVRVKRLELEVLPVFKSVDTCAAEFEAYTPYYYSTYEHEDELPEKSEKKRVIILGGGPNRIGQGIEFDYCCCHASFALREMGYESIMVNSNPETVSTDYDTSDILFFEPLTIEDVPQHLRCDTAGWRDRSVRRPNAAQPCPRPQGFGCADHRNERRDDRSGRRSRAFSSVDRRARAASAAQRYRPQHGRSSQRSGTYRIPGARSSEFRFGRTRDGDLLRQIAVRTLCHRSFHRRRRSTGAHRPLSRRRYRGRRRCTLRWEKCHDHGDHGTHRGGRRTQWRLGLRHPHRFRSPSPRSPSCARRPSNWRLP